MIFGVYPFSTISHVELIWSVKKGDYYMPKTVPLSLEGKQFIKTCLQSDPALRDWENVSKNVYLASQDYDFQSETNYEETKNPD